MSVCTFIASDHPLNAKLPPEDACFEFDPEQDYFLYPFHDADLYSEKPYGVSLEWEYTEEAALKILAYIAEALQNAEHVEVWHIWLTDPDERPVIHTKVLSFLELTAAHIKELCESPIFNQADKREPDRPSFYRLRITR